MLVIVGLAVLNFVRLPWLLRGGYAWLGDPV
jgi:hypothetical protein